MAVEFKVINASFSASHEVDTYFGDNEPESETYLNYEISTVDELILENGYKIKEKSGFLRVFTNIDRKNANTNFAMLRDEMVGLVYCDKYEYVISVAVPNNQYENLLTAAGLGRVPSSIDVVFSNKVQHPLNNSLSDNYRCYVESVEFSVPLAYGSLQADSLPATELQTRLLTQQMKKVNMKIAWLIAVTSILGLLIVVIK